MKLNQWTLGLAAVGLVSLPAVVQAEEASQHVLTALSSTTISGFVDTSAQWNIGRGSANAAAIPANPTGYWIINVAGTAQKVPYYAN